MRQRTPEDLRRVDERLLDYQRRHPHLFDLVLIFGATTALLAMYFLGHLLAAWAGR
jgi:hypothetical protein